MSDGRTESIRWGRKCAYLENITIKKDEVFDRYRFLLDKAIQISKSMTEYKNSINIIGLKFHDKEKFIIMEKELINIEKEKFHLEELLLKFDNKYKKAEQKPLREFH